MKSIVDKVRKYFYCKPVKSLGRWNTIVGLNGERDVYRDMVKNCDLANHDNCGGFSCRTIPKTLSKQINIKNK